LAVVNRKERLAESAKHFFHLQQDTICKKETGRRPGGNTTG
jgi:hypothetical protein